MILTPGTWNSPIPELPDPMLLERICRGMRTDQSHHPVLESVTDLAVLHRDRLTRGRCAFAERRFEHDRQRNASRIDRVVAAAVAPAREEARVHTETIGAVIDRMTCWSAMLHDPIAAEYSGDELALIEACVVELRSGYAALLDELAAGICRMPAITSLTPVTFTGHDLLTRRRDW